MTAVLALYLDDVLLETKSGLDSDEIYVDTFKIGFTSRLMGKQCQGYSTWMTLPPAMPAISVRRKLEKTNFHSVN